MPFFQFGGGVPTAAIPLPANIATVLAAVSATASAPDLMAVSFAFLAGVLVLLCHKLRRERPFVFAPQHGQRDKMATSLAMSRRRKVGIELGT
jgi:hypothetical protein